MGDEHLGTAGVQPGISDTDCSAFITQGRGLAGNIEPRPAPTGPGRITTLSHEVADHPMPAETLVEVAIGELADDRHMPRGDVGIENDGDRAFGGLQVPLDLLVDELADFDWQLWRRLRRLASP